MDEHVVWVDFDTMERFMVDVFKGVGVPEDDARVCADVLITADKRGIDSHGVGRLKSIYYDRIKAGIQSPVTDFEIVREGPTTAVVDGHNGMGHLVSKKAMDLAIQKAGRFGMGMVAVRNSTHYGIAGYYVLMATQVGMIGITGSNARPSVAPTFGVENVLGTNPFTFGMPTDEEFPFVLDCATSLAQRGKIELYDRAEKETPPGWVVDQEGKTRTDTHQILKELQEGKAALAPLGGIGEETAGYKGYGYAAVVEILSAALQGGVVSLGCSQGCRMGKRTPVPSGIFLSRSISPTSSMWHPLARRPAISSGNSGHPGRCPANQGSIRRVKRNIWPGWSGRIRGFPSTGIFSGKSCRCNMTWASPGTISPFSEAARFSPGLSSAVSWHVFLTHPKASFGRDCTPCWREYLWHRASDQTMS